ncbi:MAG: DUF4037 domain-containing protein [Bacillota bacterium]
MAVSTEAVLNKIIEQISAIDRVKAIGITGSKSPLPKAGEGDIDVFIYCDEIPELQKRREVVNQMGEMLQGQEFEVFKGGHWGTGDMVLINGVETWLMYSTMEETLKDIDSILKGEYPDKLDNYYYPIGRCAMLKNIIILHEKNGFLTSLREKLSIYPEDLVQKLTDYHSEQLEDIEDLERAVSRKDVLFYHSAMDLAIDHFLQALFAMNKTFFPSRKRTISYINGFASKPDNCSERLLEVVRLGSYADGVADSYRLWCELVGELKKHLC